MLLKYKINYSILNVQTKSLQQSGTEINIHAGYPKCFSVLGAFSFFSHLSNDYSPNFKVQLYNLMSKNINVKHILDAEEILKFYGYNNLLNSYHVEINNSSNFNGYIEELEAFYLFDFELQSILFKYLITIENFFKNMIGYHVSQKIGRTQKQYLNPNKYKNKKSINSQINKIESRLNDYKTYKKYPFNKYLNKNLIPATTYFSNITFGNAVYFFDNLDKNISFSITSDIISKNKPIKIEDKLKLLKETSKFLLEYRNQIAHGKPSLNININKLINAKILNHFIAPEVMNQKLYTKHKNKLFMLLLLIIILLPREQIRTNFLFDINRLINDFTNNYGNSFMKCIYEITDLPMDFYYRLKLANKQIW